MCGLITIQGGLQPNAEIVTVIVCPALVGQRGAWGSPHVAPPAGPCRPGCCLRPDAGKLRPRGPLW
eukprot:scaffold649497_cov48-Prasinocladus_malaysianus.AAC.1